MNFLKQIVWMLCWAVASLVLATSTVHAQVPAKEAGRVQKKTGYAAINGLKMYYEITGQGRPAVFIHPMVSHCGLLPTVDDDRQWIAMDLQGHGRTADIDRPMTCQQHADDIAALLKHLNIDQTDFFGDSFGGAIAMTMALRHPELVRRVVIYGTPLTPLPNDIASVLKHDSKVFRWEREQYLSVAPDPNHWPVLFDKVLQCGAKWEGITAGELKTIKAPVLIACGDHDLIPIERCIELSRTIPNAQLAVIPDASHFVLFSEPKKLLPVIAAFFDEADKKVPLATFDTGYYPGATR